MLTQPTLTPDTSPVVAPMLATEVFELDHVPPGVPLISVVVRPWQTVAAPLIGKGERLTVTGVER